MMHFSGVCLVTRDIQRLAALYRSLFQVEPEGDDIHVNCT